MKYYLHSNEFIKYNIQIIKLKTLLMTEAGNTYQLEPHQDEVFYPSRAKRIIE